jgi:hypothetical protein
MMTYTLQVPHLHDSGSAGGELGGRGRKTVRGKTPIKPTPVLCSITSMCWNLSPGISMTRITPPSAVPTISERIVIFILRIAVLGSSSVVSGEFGAVVRGNERLIETTTVSTRRRSLGRREVRSAGVGLVWIRSEWVLVL